MLTKEQQLFNLNGTFEGLDKIMEYTLNNKDITIKDIQKFIIQSMEQVSRDMNEIENELGI